MITTDILINDKIWKTQNSKIKSFVKNLVSTIIPQIKLLENAVEIEVSIVLTNDEEIQNLNKNYRKKDKPTNVLSFPAIDPKNFENGDFLKQNFLAIGDIILSFDRIKKEAEEQNKTFENHLTHLIIHSILHLIGYDHETKKEAKIMEQLEIDLLKKLAIKNHYIIIG
jgi:probable rRNA maturation factor